MSSTSILRTVLAATASVTVMVGCAQPPTNAPTASGASNANPSSVVAPAALAGINDAGKQAAASVVSTNIGAALRANATMRDAGLLSTSATAGAYTILSEGTPTSSPAPSGAPAPAASGAPPAAPGDDRDDRGRGDRARGQGDAHKSEQGRERGQARGDDKLGAQGNASGTMGRDDDDDQGRVRRKARADRDRLSDDDKKRVGRLVDDHETRLKAKLARKLAKKAKRFARQGSDKLVARADGGKDITATFTVTTADGTRTVTTTRSLDAAGNLTETTQKLAGSAGATTFSGTRTAVVNADGSNTVVSNVASTVGGQTSTVKLTSQVAVDGTTTASGTLATPDGKTIPLQAAGTEGGHVTVSATDPATGVAVKLEADDATGSATASADAGSAGKATVQVKTDEDDQDEPGDRRNDDRGQGDDHKSEQGRENGRGGDLNRGGAQASGTVSPKN